ncbi:hypothetical protein JIQ42_03276 [Leishmania sp. Namibia]|uniref:hypothetical protein n=1 Tax=Leishmania sp. Namibia TaxID=2802991 RepID=UPI001B57B162|nr:hypothetical protein JIQ42_03276 [Leishmania sp. Namibia]
MTAAVRLMGTRLVEGRRSHAFLPAALSLVPFTLTRGCHVGKGGGIFQSGKGERLLISSRLYEAA